MPNNPGTRLDIGSQPAMLGRVKPTRPDPDPTNVYGSAHDDQGPPDSERRSKRGDLPATSSMMPSRPSVESPGLPFKNLRSGR